MSKTSSARPTSMRSNKAALKGALALLAIAISAWVLLRAFAMSEPELAQARDQERARQERLREEQRATPPRDPAPAGRRPG